VAARGAAVRGGRRAGVHRGQQTRPWPPPSGRTLGSWCCRRPGSTARRWMRWRSTTTWSPPGVAARQPRLHHRPPRRVRPTRPLQLLQGGAGLWLTRRLCHDVTTGRTPTGFRRRPRPCLNRACGRCESGRVRRPPPRRRPPRPVKGEQARAPGVSKGHRGQKRTATGGATSRGRGPSSWGGLGAGGVERLGGRLPATRALLRALSRLDLPRPMSRQHAVPDQDAPRETLAGRVGGCRHRQKVCAPLRSHELVPSQEGSRRPRRLANSSSSSRYRRTQAASASTCASGPSRSTR
jgi:hypothetical protein